MKTTHKRAADIGERWYLYDASEHTLGRMAAEIAWRLMGKDRPSYTPSELCGAQIVVIQAEKARFTGTKDDQKLYRRYSGYAGGLYLTPLATLRQTRPHDVVRFAVRRMLPKTTLGRKMLSRLKVYAGSEHPHSAQKPVKIEKLLR